jgi:hypothetical protein
MLKKMSKFIDRKLKEKYGKWTRIKKD